MVPFEFEKVGSVVHSEKADPSLLILTTDNKSESKDKVASTAFILSPLGTALTTAVKVWPAE